MILRQTTPPQPGRRAFTLVECMIATAVCAIIFLATISLLGFARLSNEVEQERTRAHQIVCEELEVRRMVPYPQVGDPSHSWQVTHTDPVLWDSGTPLDKTDDITGKLELVVRDAKTGTILNGVPNPPVLVSIEATLTWSPPGRMSGRTLRESAVGLKSP